MRFANDFHSWLRHSWKSLANRLTRDPKIVIHGNSCIILYISHVWHKHKTRELLKYNMFYLWDTVYQQGLTPIAAWENDHVYCLLSHPGLSWPYVFSLFPPRPPPQRLLPVTSKPFELNVRYLGQRIYRSEKCTGLPLHDLDPRSRLWHWLVQIVCLHDKVRTIPSITSTYSNVIVLVTFNTWFDFEGVLL